jgi:lysyl-tRNA synthetase class 1
MKEKSLFWADQLAEEILNRKKFKYVDKPVPKMKKFVVKTSASISGVLHIGRLSDTIRSESVCKALLDTGHKAELIWVAEDMDPLRKIPEGVPKTFEKYLGMPVTDIPDPFGCHASYADHNKSEYFSVLDQFVSTKMTKYSMREEYKKGNFRPYIKNLLEKMEDVIKILNKYRTEPIKSGWSPWKPICENCGKIITPRILEFDGKFVRYVCEDYSFKTTTVKGCGYEGENDPLEGNGKLMWKGEWASQWARWQVCSEGAGKEYQVPMSAWWVNGEIVEKILDFPMPVPIFYEHLMFDNKKMSASLGNVVYPYQWLEVAPAELLRFFYNKKLMKTRSFSWNFLPNLFDDYDQHADVFFGKKSVENKREEEHMKRLFEMSQIKKPKDNARIPFSFATMISQLCDPKTQIDKAIEILKFTGHIKEVTEDDKKEIQKRLVFAKNWVNKYAPQMAIKVVEEPYKGELTENEKNAISMLAEELKKSWSEKELQFRIFEIARENSIEPERFFKLCYNILLGKDSGPRLGPFILVVGKEKVAKLLSEASK